MVYHCLRTWCDWTTPPLGSPPGRLSCAAALKSMQDAVVSTYWPEVFAGWHCFCVQHQMYCSNVGALLMLQFHSAEIYTANLSPRCPFCRYNTNVQHQLGAYTCRAAQMRIQYVSLTLWLLFYKFKTPTKSNRFFHLAGQVNSFLHSSVTQ